MYWWCVLIKVSMTSLLFTLTAVTGVCPVIAPDHFLQYYKNIIHRYYGYCVLQYLIFWWEILTKLPTTCI